MFKSFRRLAKHMEEEHPNSKVWGDSMWYLNGKSQSQKCFLCGKELIEENKEEECLNYS
jgi:hypothetical protein